VNVVTGSQKREESGIEYFYMRCYHIVGSHVCSFSYSIVYMIDNKHE
jgi:hypothetical protein